ncbi:sigma factor [Streptomyces ochraceiscleroticus]|uniref:Sigma factor n=1 Tax=Streptomyces ochraceiscleroticus TaxID=47761 RepID=A0ABW1MT50_9ACTN
MLGSVSEAEDVVQDAYARWYALPRSRQEEILSPGAWLTTVTSRICLDLLGSAWARRERYVGAWLPEPLPDRTEWDHAGGAGPTGLADPADQIVLDERVNVARGPVTVTGRADVVRHVKEAWESKDIAALVGLLDPAAVMTADGGGMVGTVLRPVEGGARIAQYMVAIADKAPGLELLERSVNGVPGLVAQRAGVVMTVASFDVSDGCVTRIWAVRNPEKLRPWA